MIRNISKYLLISFLFICISFAGLRNEPQIEEHLGNKIPLDLNFNDAYGNKVSLKDLCAGKATVIDFAYYECPGICNPIMQEVAQIVGQMDIVPGKDYNIITISMDPKETPKIALREKKKFLNVLPAGFPPTAWRFLTGDSASIAKATDAAGFYFKKDGNNFIHTGVLIFVTKDGKICRYLYPRANPDNEFSILPSDFKMASLQTAKGTQMSMVGKLVQFCFASIPKGNSKLAKILAFSGAGVIFLTFVFIVFFIVRPNKKNS